MSLSETGVLTHPASRKHPKLLPEIRAHGYRNSIGFTMRFLGLRSDERGRARQQQPRPPNSDTAPGRYPVSNTRRMGDQQTRSG